MRGGERRLQPAALDRGGHQLPPHRLEDEEPAGQRALQGAQQPERVVEALHRAERRLHALRLRMQPEHHAGDDAERALRADEHLRPVVAGVVLQHLVERAHHAPVGEHHLEAEHVAPRHAVAQHLVAAGVGGDVAADGAGAARAEVDAAEEAGLVGGRLDEVQRRAGERGQRAARARRPPRRRSCAPGTGRSRRPCGCAPPASPVRPPCVTTGRRCGVADRQRRRDLLRRARQQEGGGRRRVEAARVGVVARRDVGAGADAVGAEGGAKGRRRRPSCAASRGPRLEPARVRPAGRALPSSDASPSRPNTRVETARSMPTIGMADRLVRRAEAGREGAVGDGERDPPVVGRRSATGPSRAAAPSRRRDAPGPRRRRRGGRGRRGR